MNEIDAYVGFWLDDMPYRFYDAGNIKESRRIYENNIDILNEIQNSEKCEEWLKQYFSKLGVLTKIKMAIGAPMVTAPVFRNGRIDYLRPDVTNLKPGITLPLHEDQKSVLSRKLQEFSGVTFHLSSLICSQLKLPRSTDANDILWPEIIDTMRLCPPLSSCDPCTVIGNKIATSLIKIAALRIFADPEQSIIELPVNSIDAYGQMQNRKKIGKFGMGFFSILYWLIGHPKRKLTITSFAKVNSAYQTYKTVIRDNEERMGDLLFDITTYPDSEITKTGVRIDLDATEDKFTQQNVLEFNEQFQKLKYVNFINLYLTNKYQDTDAGPRLNIEKSEDIYAIFCGISVDGFYVEDFATGLPLEVLFSSTFVPSISTKTLKDDQGGNEKIPDKGYPRATNVRFIYLSRRSRSNFYKIKKIYTVSKRLHN